MNSHAPSGIGLIFCDAEVVYLRRLNVRSDRPDRRPAPITLGEGFTVRGRQAHLELVALIHRAPLDGASRRHLRPMDRCSAAIGVPREPRHPVRQVLADRRAFNLAGWLNAPVTVKPTK